MHEHQTRGPGLNAQRQNVSRDEGFRESGRANGRERRTVANREDDTSEGHVDRRCEEDRRKQDERGLNGVGHESVSSTASGDADEIADKLHCEAHGSVVVATLFTKRDSRGKSLTAASDHEGYAKPFPRPVDAPTMGDGDGQKQKCEDHCACYRGQVFPEIVAASVGFKLRHLVRCLGMIGSGVKILAFVGRRKTLNVEQATIDCWLQAMFSTGQLEVYMSSQLQVHRCNNLRCYVASINRTLTYQNRSA